MKPSRRNPLFANFFRGNTLATAVVVSLAGFAAPDSARAADSYWDSNGTTAGAGATPTGTWGTNTYWSANSGGTVATTAWTSGNVAIFSAGTDATTGYTVTLSGTQTINGLTVEEGTPTITGGTALALGVASTPFNITGTATINSPITGATRTIAKSGTGTLTLGGVIGTTSGGLSVTAGTLVVGNTANTFTGGVSVDGSSAILQMNQSTKNATSGPLGIITGGGSYKTVTLNNGGIFRPILSFNSDVPTAALPGNGYVFSIGSGGGVFDIGTGVTLTLDDGSGAGTGTGNSQLQGSGTLTKTGVGTLSLGNGTSNFGVFTGPIVVNAGILTTGAVSTTPFGATSAGTTIASGAALNLKGVSIGAEPLTISGLGLASLPVAAIYSSAGAGTATGPITLAANSNIGGANGITLSGVISGGFVLSKVGIGTATLSGANTYSGGTVISDGSLQMNHNSAAGSGDIALVAGGTTGTPTRLTINGGVTIGNNVNMGPTTGLAGNGSIQQVGTGQGRVNGTINITGGPTAGGHFVGGGAVGNELVLGGPIYSTVTGLSHREGRIVYAGGGSGWNSLNVTNTAIIGATNGIPTEVNVFLGGSGNAALNLNGYNQTLSGLLFGNTGSAFTSTVNLGSNTLGLTGGIISQSNVAHNVTHLINATAGGALNVGTSPVSINLNNTAATDDLIITGAAINGTGGIVKDGAGTLALNNVTVAGPLVVNAGTLATGTINLTGTLAAGSLDFQSGTTLRMKVGASGDLISTGTLTTAGTTTVALTQAGGSIAAGTYPLITYTGTSPGLSGFSLNPIGRVGAVLVDTGTAIALQVSSASSSSITWDGTTTSDWTGTNNNWLLTTGLTPTDYIENDTVLFKDGPTSDSVVISTNVSPAGVAFSNTSATTYYVSGTGGIIGNTGLSKTGDGTVNLGTPNEYYGGTFIDEGALYLTGSLTNSSITVADIATFSATGPIRGTGVSITSSGTTDLAPTAGNPNTYTGATTILDGTFNANYTNALALPAASPVSVAADTTLSLTHSGGTFALTNPLTGAGTVVIDPATSGGGNRDIATVTWDASAFTGKLRLAPTTGTMRMQVDSLADIGTGPIEIANGGQIIVMGNNMTFPHNFTISGTGYAETGGSTLGAIRAANATTTTTTFTGTITISDFDPLTLSDSAKIGAMAGTGNTGTVLITNTIGGGNLTFGGVVGNTTGEILALTGNASTLTSLTVNDGTATGSASSITVNVGFGSTSGTLGTVPVFLKADGYKNAVIRFDRTDGYTLGGAVSSAATTAANEVRNFLDFDCTGTGFSDGGLTNTLGLASPAAGGRVRIGQNRPNSIATLTGSLTSEILQLAGGQNNATLNIGNAAVVTANQFHVGESSNNSGTVNQAAGSTVNVLGQVRVGHFGSETSTYNLNGGILTLTGDSPVASPSTPAGGGNASYGDNNINSLATSTIHGGGVYIGIDGTGVFNHNGGTLTTNWIVLDNRGASGAGLNMLDGIDRYNISGSSVLNLRSTWGLLGRNDGSYDVSLGGGTIKVDNTGTGTGTGSNLTVPIDAILSTVASTTTTLDTNGSGNALTLSKNVNGTGTLALTGSGIINLSTGGVQNVSANISGANNLAKLGGGATTLAGSMSGYTGSVDVVAGRLNIPSTLNTSVTVQSGAVLSGEVSLASLTLNGGTLLFDPNTGGSLSATTLDLAANSLIDVSAAPGGGLVTAFTYGTKTGSGTLTVANGSNYRTPPVLTDTGSAVTVDFTAGKALTWTGAASTAWNINSAINWTDGVIAETFYSGDSVTFPEGGANPSIALTGLLAPAGVSVTSDTTAYTFTSTAGNLITGTTGLAKSGGSTLTLVGANEYSGITGIAGGTLSIAAANSIGNGLAGNSIALSNGGKLAYTGTTAIDLGPNRSIAIGTGGGVLAHSSATGLTLTIPGALSGSGALNIQSTAAGGGTFFLTGSNSAYTGPITVNSLGTGLTTLRINDNAALPNASSITLNYPALGAQGNVTALALAHGCILPATTTVNLTSAQTTVSLRTQIGTTGAVTIDSPITASGTGIVQINASAGSTATVNGTITEGTPAFVESAAGTNSNTFFLRGAGTTILNGQINLPSAGSTINVTDGATGIINSTGNIYKKSTAAYGTLRIGATNALPTTGLLLIGQGSNEACTLDLNGFDQTVTGLESAGTTVALNRGISNSHATATSTLTVIQATAPLANFLGSISGRTNFVKEGAATLTLTSPLSNYTGNVEINEGQLTIAATHNDTNANSALGNPLLDTRSVTVNSGATLAFVGNDNLGNAGASPIMPIIVENGGVMTTSGFNTLGPVFLNGGTMASTGGANATWQAYRLFGTVTVGGAAPSAMTASGANSNYHLHSSTTFDVSNATGDAAADLTVSAPLMNQSATQASAPGNLIKAGVGTMILSGVNIYTGNTTVNAGTLELADNAQLRFVIGAASGTNNSISGSGTAVLEGDFAIDTTAATALSAGTWTLENVASLTGPYGANFRVVNTDGSPWAVTGDTWTKTVGSKIWTFDEATGVLTLSLSGFNSWAEANGASGQTPDQDHDLDGVENGVEYFMGATGSTFTANPALAGGSVSWPKSALFNGTYRVETSPDLVTWTNVTGAAVDNGSSVTYTLPTGDPKLFVHLVVIPN